MNRQQRRAHARVSRAEMPIPAFPDGFNFIAAMKGYSPIALADLSDEDFEWATHALAEMERQTGKPAQLFRTPEGKPTVLSAPKFG